MDNRYFCTGARESTAGWLTSIISAITTDFEDATSEFLFNDMGEFTGIKMTGSAYDGNNRRFKCCG